jgi:hypothetical protein
MDIDIQWGGYYVSKDKNSGQYSVFRLLDFNRYAYHAAIFKERFSETPKPEDILTLTPYIGHAPIDAKALLNDELVILAAIAPLKKEDLEGYRFYLEHNEMTESDIDDLFRNIIEFSNQPSLKLSLELVDGELEISER